MGRQRNFIGQSFWARGYYISTAGRDKETISQYIRKQEEVNR
jgi:putative transposase